MSKDTGGPAMSAVTQWFPGDVKPVRIGVYEVLDDECEFPNDRWYAYWDGHKFWFRTLSAHRALALGKEKTSTRLPPRATWRGLAEEPK